MLSPSILQMVYSIRWPLKMAVAWNLQPRATRACLTIISHPISNATQAKNRRTGGGSSSRHVPEDCMQSRWRKREGIIDIDDWIVWWWAWNQFEFHLEEFLHSSTHLLTCVWEKEESFRTWSVWYFSFSASACAGVWPVLFLTALSSSNHQCSQSNQNLLVNARRA